MLGRVAPPGAVFERAELVVAMSEAARRGGHVAILEVRAGNAAAQSLYRRHGFDVTGRRQQYYRNPTEDALVMCATLE